MVAWVAGALLPAVAGIVLGQEPPAAVAPSLAPGGSAAVVAPAPEPPVTLELQGSIRVTHDAEHRLRVLRFLDEKSARVYHIRIDEQAAELAKMDTAQTVKASAIAEPKPDDLGRLWVTVKAFSVVDKPKDAPAAPARP